MIQINTRRAPALYIGFMGAWIYGFAASAHRPPALVVALLFLLPVAIHLGVGYAIGRWEAVVLAGVPVVLAMIAAGLASGLWIFMALLMIFPGGPLIAAGVYLRQWREEKENPADELWLL